MLRDQRMTPEWRIAVLDANDRLIACTLSDDAHDPGIGSEPDWSLLKGLRSGRPGTEAIVKIRKLFDSNIPGVILTGETGLKCTEDASAHGFSIAHKPITSRQLSMAVEKLLAQAAE